MLAQSNSVVSMLLSKDNERTLIDFLHDGLTTDDWAAALEQHYKLTGPDEFDNAWNEWIAR